MRHCLRHGGVPTTKSFTLIELHEDETDGPVQSPASEERESA